MYYFVFIYNLNFYYRFKPWFKNSIYISYIYFFYLFIYLAIKIVNLQIYKLSFTIESSILILVLTFITFFIYYNCSIMFWLLWLYEVCQKRGHDEGEKSNYLAVAYVEPKNQKVYYLISLKVYIGYMISKRLLIFYFIHLIFLLPYINYKYNLYIVRLFSVNYLTLLLTVYFISYNIEL